MLDPVSEELGSCDGQVMLSFMPSAMQVQGLGQGVKGGAVQVQGVGQGRARSGAWRVGHEPAPQVLGMGRERGVGCGVVGRVLSPSPEGRVHKVEGCRAGGL